MRLHVEVLGLLHLVWGGFGLLTGTSLFLVAIGTDAALDTHPAGLSERAAVGVLITFGAVLFTGGAASALTGRALRKLQAKGRLVALVLAIPNLILVPFGTALGIYTFWVLLNDETRREFGRPLRAPALVKT